MLAFCFLFAAATEPLDVKLAASTGTPIQLSQFRGGPMVIFYEDQNSVRINKPLKDELWNRRPALAATQAHVLGIAYLKPYDFFPVRGFALERLRAMEKRSGIPILADLKGEMGQAPWSLPARGSTVLLVDKEGHVVFRKTGALSDEEVKQVVANLEKLTRA
jgi:peroxiredoxin